MLRSHPLRLAGRPHAAIQACPARLVPPVRRRQPVYHCPKLVPELWEQRRVARLVGSQTGPTAPPGTDTAIKAKKQFWTFLDILAILGSVGGALAAILNLFSGTYVLFLPLVLPVVSLLSALQREGLIAEDNRRAYDTLRVTLARDSSAMLADARSAIEEVRRELRGQNTTAARLGTIESRLSSLEGSILSAGRSAREAASGLGLLPERLQAEQRAAHEVLVGALRVELRRAAEALANNETTCLARLDARLAAVEGSLSGLEVAQSEGLRRLSLSLNSALADAEASLQSSVRNEVARSMEPVRRLPQMLAAALPPALAAAEAIEAGPLGIGSGGAGGGGAAAVSPEQLQAILSQEVENAVGRIVAFQSDAFGRLNAPRPVPMDDEQWSALGRRLTRIERLVEGTPVGTEGALIQSGQLAAALAAATRDAVTLALTEAAAAAARENSRVRDEVAAATAEIRGGLAGVAESLTELQRGVADLAAVVAAQQQQAAEAVEGGVRGSEEGMAREGEGAASEHQSQRFLEGLAAVARLLRDMDEKMDRVAAAVVVMPQGEQAEMAAASLRASPSGAVVTATEEGPAASKDAATSAAAAVEAATAAMKQQQQEIQTGMDSVRQGLAALTAQITALAASTPAPAQPLSNVSGGAAPSSPSELGTAADRGSGGSGNLAAAEVLAFERNLATGDVSADDGGIGPSGPASVSSRREGGVAAALPPAGTTGSSRDEAYDMMLRLAEARRRSGAEAGVSGSAAGGGDSNGGSGGGGGGGAMRGGAGVDGAAYRREELMGQQQLWIDGLPPFEGGEQEDGGGREGMSSAPQQQQQLNWFEEQRPTLTPQQQSEPPMSSNSYTFPQQELYPEELMYGSTAMQPPSAQSWPAAHQAPSPPYSSSYDQLPTQFPDRLPPPGQPGARGGPPPYWNSAATAPALEAPSSPPSPSPYGMRPPTPPSSPPSPGTPPVGRSPSFRASPGPPSPQQQQQQQPNYLQQSQPPPLPPIISSPPQPPQQQQQQQPGVLLSTPPDYRPRALEGLGPIEVISEGLRLLRLGREETRKGEDYGLADSLIQSAITAFSRAAELAPGDAKALGNLGNALLARGELKAAYLEVLRSGPPPSTLSESESQRGAEVALTGEANGLLTEAGVMFKKVLELEGWSSRALVNWGRALVIRADLLAASPEELLPGGQARTATAQLYGSAISKFEGVLEGEPDMVPAKYRCALAMAGLSRTKPQGSREAATLLSDAINYLRDVLASSSPDAEWLRPAAGAALAQYEAALAAQRGARKQQ